MEKYTALNVEDIVPIVAKYGVCIYENVLTDEECSTSISQTWDFFEELYPVIDRNNQDTWKYIYDLKPLHGMLFQHWGIGHAQYIWDLRSKPKIIEIFKVIWNIILKNKYPERNENVQNLKVSFDGASFGIPPEVTSRGWNGKDWFHIDQRYKPIDAEENIYTNMQCIQSWITTENVEHDDATLSILEGSNVLHSEIGPLLYEKAIPKVKSTLYKNDWYKFSQDELNTYYRDCVRVNIECKAGSMVFWDSRTVHCGRGPIRNRQESRFRNVVYLCYMPSFMVSDKIIAKRRKAFNDLRTTNHWPNKSKLFNKMPRIYSSDTLAPELKQYKKIKPTNVDESLI
jgi:hypothetical protein